MIIESSYGDYSIAILDTTAQLVDSLKYAEYRGLLIDQNIASLFPVIKDLTLGLPTLAIRADEDAKQYRNLEAVFDWLAENKFDRKSPLLVIGGGAIQDIATFCAATFHRGLPWTFIPTTLLSQADSCIGGKCGINLGQLKNQVGLVYPPRGIFANSEFLKTLKKDELVAGMGEILKISLTGKDQFWEEYLALTVGTDINNLDFTRLTHLALAAKKYVIELDEFELDYRRVLNYGHTLGHAIEAASDFSVNHGIGVILGIKAISRLGLLWGLTDQDLADRVVASADQLLTQCSANLSFSVEKAIGMVQHDKKSAGGAATFIVLRKPGEHDFVKRQINDDLANDLRVVLNEL
jgi:3-dehydroquinate synthase